MSDEPEIGARHLMLCREVIWNADDPEAPYTLRGVLRGFHPSSGFPAITPHPVYVYAEYHGGEGEYDVWFDLVRLVSDEAGEIIDEADETTFGPFYLRLFPDLFAQGRSYVLRRVPFSEPGVYELRLRIGGVTQHLITERLIVEG